MRNSPETLPSVVVQSQDPAVIIPALLSHLRTFGRDGQRKATWIADVYSEVLKGIEQQNLQDPMWIGDLLDVCCKQLNALAQVHARVKGHHFGEHHFGQWGWS